MKKKAVFVLFALAAMALISCATLMKEHNAVQLPELSAADVKSCQFLGNIHAEIYSIAGSTMDNFIASAKQRAKIQALDMGADTVVFDKPGGVGSILTGKAYKCH
ncbi:MAG TPA: DUF4156 domain-containing protein [Smithella sp.]|nr:DUF4156 domain-containing protein [Smithella sp.]